MLKKPFQFPCFLYFSEKFDSKDSYNEIREKGIKIKSAKEYFTGCFVILQYLMYIYYTLMFLFYFFYIPAAAEMYSCPDLAMAERQDDVVGFFCLRLKKATNFGMVFDAGDT